MNTSLLIFLGGVIAIQLLALYLVSRELKKATQAQANAEIELKARSLHVSSCCNWAALNTSRAHPEVEIVCKAIETAFHTKELPDADRLHLELTKLKAGLPERRIITHFDERTTELP